MASHPNESPGSSDPPNSINLEVDSGTNHSVDENHPFTKRKRAKKSPVWKDMIKEIYDKETLTEKIEEVKELLKKIYKEFVWQWNGAFDEMAFNGGAFEEQ
ncbi:hypothetical protein Tco_0451569 [Tanacetum coccineum]